MDTSLYKRMGVSGRSENAHLFGMPSHWKSETGSDKTHSDKTCVKHHSQVNDTPNMRYYAKGGKVKRERLAVGAVAKIRKGQY